jgi:uncharacterized protein YrzB (UPF0473 family)
MTDQQNEIDNDHNHEETVVTFTDENGVEHDFILVYTFETERGEYAVLLKKDEPDADGILLKIIEEDGEEFFVDIEDDEEWSFASNIYEGILAENQE